MDLTDVAGDSCQGEQLVNVYGNGDSKDGWGRISTLESFPVSLQSFFSCFSLGM